MSGADPDAGFRARVYVEDFRPGARFEVVSGPIDYKPQFAIQEGESFLIDQYWAGFGTRIAEYGNTNERVLFFPRTDAPVREDRRYRFAGVTSTDQLAPGVVAVRVEPV